MAHGNRRAATGVACLLLAGGPTVAPADAASRAAVSYGHEAEVATDHQRAKRDIKVLGPSDCLRKYAVRQARRMAREERIWHQSLGVILRDCGMDFVGENVAAGYPSGRAAVDDGWMDSPSHRRNVLEPGFRLVEVAARKGGDGRWYAAQVFGRRG